MYKTKQLFDAFKDRGDKYMLILQKRQKDAEPLTLFFGGSSGQVEMQRMEFSSSGPYSGGNNWGYAFVAKLNTQEPWEKHEEYLRGLDFKW